MVGRYFVFWWLLLFIPLIIGVYAVPINTSSPVSYVLNPVFPWANFDGIHYSNIAKYGYTNQARFFPLLPLAMSVFPSPVQFWVGFLFINICFFLALFVFKKLVEIDYSRDISKKTIINLLIFPTSFFFVCIYSESLFLLLTLLAFYFARKKRWLLACIFAALLTATRFVGIAILPALLYEFVSNKKINLREFAVFLIVPLGLIFYSIFNYYKWHDFFYFIRAQGELGNNRTVDSLVLFPQTIFRYMKIISSVPVGYEWGIALLELTAFLFAAIFLYFAWRKKIRTSYLIFGLINFAIATMTGTFSALPRYVLTIFPIFIALALIENKVFKLAYIIISLILLFVLLMLFSRGYFVA